MDIHARAAKLAEKCNDYITLEFVKNDDGNIIKVIEHLKENVSEEVKSAFLELSNLKNSGLLAEIR